MEGQQQVPTFDAMDVFRAGIWMRNAMRNRQFRRSFLNIMQMGNDLQPGMPVSVGAIHPQDDEADEQADDEPHPTLWKRLRDLLAATFNAVFSGARHACSFINVAFQIFDQMRGECVKLAMPIFESFGLVAGMACEVSFQGLDFVARLGSALLAIVMGLITTARDKFRALLRHGEEEFPFDLLIAEAEEVSSFGI